MALSCLKVWKGDTDELHGPHIVELSNRYTEVEPNLADATNSFRGRRNAARGARIKSTRQTTVRIHPGYRRLFQGEMYLKHKTVHHIIQPVPG